MSKIEWHKVQTGGTWDGRNRYYCMIGEDKIFIEENSPYQFMSGWTVLSSDLMIINQELKTHDFEKAKGLAIEKIKEIVSSRKNKNESILNRINELIYE